MDVNREIEVLEEPGRSTSRVTNGFSIAPPQLCQRWASPHQTQLGNLNQKNAAPSSPQWIDTREANYQCEAVSPIITNVESLSHTKTPVITNVVSLSPLKTQRQAIQPNHLSSYSLNNEASAQVHAGQSKMSSFKKTASNQPFSSLPRIKSVISLSPLKNRVGSNGTVNASSKIQIENCNHSQEPECITIDEDEDGSDTPSNKPDGESQDSCIIEEEIRKDCNKGLETIEDIEGDGSDSNSFDVKGSWIIREDLQVCESTDTTVTGSSQYGTTVPRNNGDLEASLTRTFADSKSLGSHGKRAEVKTKLSRQCQRIKPVSVMPDHQTVDDFMTLCKRIDPSDDMKTILENKLMKHVKGCSNEFLQSQKYKHLLKDHIKKITDDPRNVYVYISDFLKELKARKAPQNNEDPHPSKKRKVDQGKVNYEELEEERTQLKIKRLSRFLSQLEKKIKELETVEVNWDDEEDSSYIILQRYKQRACKVFDKLCEYTNESKSAGTIVKIHFSGTDLVKVNKCVQNYINHTGKFPDFIDIQELIKKVNSEENLNLNDDKVQEIAKDVFTKVGEELQRLRMHSVHESLSTFQSGDDPAQTDNDLNCKLRDNHREGERRIQQVIDEFVIKEKEKKAKITSEGTEENGKNEESDQDTDEEEEEEEEEGDDDDDDDDEPFHEDHLPDLSPENEESESPDEEASGPPTEIDDTTTKSNMGLKSDGVPEESMSATNSH